MTDLGHVVVLAGGLSHERDVSIRSGRRVGEALRAIGVDVEVRDLDSSLLPALEAELPGAIFIALHGAPGEDGAVRDVLRLLGLPYVGATADACRLAFDKPTAKATLRSAGVDTPEAVALAQETFRELGAPALLGALVERIGLPLFVKPTRGGSALGATLVRTREELPPAMVAAFAYHDIAMVEHFVEGEEIAVSVIDTGDGLRALSPVEIVPDGGSYDYAARYTAGTTEFFVPARLDDAIMDRAREVAVLAHERLGLRDLSRTDLIVDADRRVQFLEVNVSPGMTETSLLPQSVAADGLDLGVVCRDLLAVAAQRG